MSKFIVGEEVSWSSQSQGYSKFKTGLVVEVVAPGALPALFQLGGSSRNHESYIVEVAQGPNAKPKKYWPIATNLSQTTAAAPRKGIQKLPGMTADQIAEKLEEIFRDVQTKIHDKWDWMNASHYVECLRSRAAGICPSCGESGLGCNQFGCWRAANPPAMPVANQLLEEAVKDLTLYASAFAAITYEQGIAFGAALAQKGVRIMLDIAGVDTPGETSVPKIGENGVRDTLHPCADFFRGDPHHSNTCEGDGHYLCGGCKNKKAPNPEDVVSHDTAGILPSS